MTNEQLAELKAAAAEMAAGMGHQLTGWALPRPGEVCHRNYCRVCRRAVLVYTEGNLPPGSVGQHVDGGAVGGTALTLTCAGEDE